LALSPKEKEKWGLWNFNFLCCDFVRFVLGIGSFSFSFSFFSFLVGKIYMVGTRQNVKKKTFLFHSVFVRFFYIVSLVNIWFQIFVIVF
jgi:hypothetical protein